MKHIKYIFCGVLMLLFVMLSPTIAKAEDSEAKKLDANISLSNGKSTTYMTNDSYSSNVSFNSGDTITISSTEAIHGLYIKWDSIPDEWTLSYDQKSVTCGNRGFLHEYIDIPEGTTSCTMTFASSEKICNLDVYSAGTLPEDVQVWQDPCEAADILVFSTHADDEILFLGGVLATYGGDQGLRVQIAYMCEFMTTAKIREHEKIDGLWRSGIKLYPINGDFPDLYSESLKHAKTIYDYDEVKAFVVENIRRFKPMIVVTQDLEGEYGHGGHMILANAVAESVENSMDASVYPESASKYGVWDVPKTYLHLYKTSPLTMNLRVPLVNMHNETSIEVQQAAYKLHVSQQWCWFYVSDDYEYSCADFGLYRTTVGNDTGNDMLENIKTYEQQEEEARKLAEEQSSIEASIAESIEASIADEEKSSQAAVEKKSKAKKTGKKLFLIITIIVIILAVLLLCAYKYISIKNARKRRRRKRRRR